ncbi:hypothetical protein LEP1GSC175_2070 [Leptospira santarosai str. HAI821]|nr:hypothetical protein LEP1GSC175_2070 [Leptospira santarosai str. HAI821]
MNRFYRGKFRKSQENHLGWCKKNDLKKKIIAIVCIAVI